MTLGFLPQAVFCSCTGHPGGGDTSQSEQGQQNVQLEGASEADLQIDADWWQGMAIRIRTRSKGVLRYWINRACIEDLTRRFIRGSLPLSRSAGHNRPHSFLGTLLPWRFLAQISINTA
jgi:hypothetical protein